jgi:hypothetical protein
MGQILHGCAKTTAATRRAIQNSQESKKTLAERYSINPKTVMKWKHRESVEDLPMGPKELLSTALSKVEEAMIFKAYPIGFFHIDITEVRTEEGKLYLFVVIEG